MTLSRDARVAGGLYVASSVARPIAYVVLRILIVLNWLSGAAIAVLLIAMLPLGYVVLRRRLASV